MTSAIHSVSIVDLRTKSHGISLLIIITVVVVLHIPAHPYKAEASGYRTCHITNML
jgi:hypothetical protein